MSRRDSTHEDRRSEMSVTLKYVYIANATQVKILAHYLTNQHINSKIYVERQKSRIANRVVNIKNTAEELELPASALAT